MNEYTIEFQSGVRHKKNFTSLLSAKRWTTKQLSFGCGDAYIYDNNDHLYKREFWQELNNFGWKDWFELS